MRTAPISSSKVTDSRNAIEETKLTSSIRPKRLLEIASFKVFTSSIHLYNAITIGDFLKSNTNTVITTNLHTLNVNSTSSNLLKSIHAPTYRNASTLNNKSITDEKTVS
jgi:hypothetical protein